MGASDVRLSRRAPQAADHLTADQLALLYKVRARIRIRSRDLSRRSRPPAHLFGALHIYSAGKSKNVQSRQHHLARRLSPGGCKSFLIRIPVPTASVKELPPDLQKGDPVNNTAEAARATVKDGTIKKTWSEDGALKYVVHHTFKSKTAGAPDTVLEVLMIVRADGKVVMATFGSPKIVPP